MKKMVFLLFGALLVGTLSVSAAKRVYLVGDESMAIPCDSSYYTWGQVLANQFAKKVEVNNHAVAGLSLKSFMTDHGLKWLAKLPKKSIVLLQVGRHDLNMSDSVNHTTHEAFTKRLQEVATRCEKNKIMLVLCTPLSVPYYKDSVLVDNLGGYDDAMRNVAAYYHLPLLDMSAATLEWLAGMDADALNQNYTNVDAPYSLTEVGAQTVAEMAVNMMKSNKILAKLLK